MRPRLQSKVGPGHYRVWLCQFEAYGVKCLEQRIAEVAEDGKIGLEVDLCDCDCDCDDAKGGDVE